MHNNDVLRRIRYIFDLSDSKMIEIFNEADYLVTRAEISNWLKKDDDTEFQNINDKELAIFLNGFINFERGRKEGIQPPPEKKLNNNIVLRKLKIALALKDDEMIEVFDIAKIRVGKSELNAFFRNPEHEQYRLCKDQFLRNFLYGLQIKYRGIDK